MQEPTVTLPISGRGDVTISEPSWCIGHAHHDPHTEYADVIHSGPDKALTFRHAELLSAMLVASPHATVTSPGLGGPTPGVHVWPLSETLDPAGVDALARALVEYACDLRMLARQLSAILGGGR
ncbi:DUF6907 domain-containing protein [Streptomyces sp. cg28]|uniref:DUF6907 domain-containing protein n=1 Tax=Streptomyces sp. cg28 TaxID=3403457 RepID=UPI003B21BFAC